MLKYSILNHDVVSYDKIVYLERVDNDPAASLITIQKPDTTVMNMSMVSTIMQASWDNLIEKADKNKNNLDKISDQLSKVIDSLLSQEFRKGAKNG
jgi:hypothetical protein